jgi:tetratricopeptide (TPR) repeat protein
MSTAARIEELRKKFDENPRRYFAPLANELRKAGELKQAIALCRDHLPKQPGHMSGYIVFGQALFEVGELDEARSVFEQALALDPENLIALHHLGHIARQQGDIAAARRWYERALETDPRNDNIAHQLAGLAVPVRWDLGAIPTPPEGQTAISDLPLPPTPDAAMRAVDFASADPIVSAPAADTAASAVTLPLDEAAIDLTFDEPLTIRP